MRIFTSILVTVIFSTTACFPAPHTGARILNFVPSAKSLALGEASTALLSDIDSIFANPAALAGIKKNQFSGTYLKNFADTGYGFAALGAPLKTGFLAAAYSYLDGGELELNNTDGTTAKVKAQQDSLLTLSYSRKISESLAGVNFKFINSELVEKYKSRTFAVDGGVIYKPYQGKNNSLSLGVALQNIGPKIKFLQEGDLLPTSIKVGSAWESINRIKGRRTELSKITLTGDLLKPIDDTFKLNFGLEYAYRRVIALRTGVKLGYDSVINTYGLGLILSRLCLDYGFSNLADLGDTHRLTLTTKFQKRIGRTS